MTQPQQVTNDVRVGGDAVTAGVQSLIEMARKLGLVWRLIPATVSAGSNAFGVVPVIFDNDFDETSTISMIGPVAEGVRVFVLSIPPQGNYIIGARGPLPAAGSLSAYFAVTSPVNVASGGGGITIPWTAIRDPFGIANAAGVLTMPKGYDGLWDVDVYLWWPITASVTGFRLLSCTVNGTTMLEDRRAANPTGNNITTNALNQPLELNATDTLSHGVFQNSGGTLTIGSATENQARVRLVMQYRGPIVNVDTT